jgi:hypothetical protein
MTSPKPPLPIHLINVNSVFIRDPLDVGIRLSCDFDSCTFGDNGAGTIGTLCCGDTSTGSVINSVNNNVCV